MVCRVSTQSTLFVECKYQRTSTHNIKNKYYIILFPWLQIASSFAEPEFVSKENDVFISALFRKRQILPDKE